MGFLTEAVERVRRDLEERPIAEGSLLLRTRVMPPALDLAAALGGPDLAIIAEFKRASPPAGVIAEGADPGERSALYERGGASAISVFTEPRHFDGSISDLRSARRRTALPILRKDFLIRPAQVIQSRAEGADAFLLISAALSGSEIEELRAVGEELGMGALVEVHSEDELEKALGAGARILCVNARDPQTLETDFDAALDLAGRVPRDLTLIIEGGMGSRRDVMRAETAGANAVLIGEALMRSDAPESMISVLAGRLARRYHRVEGPRRERRT